MKHVEWGNAPSAGGQARTEAQNAAASKCKLTTANLATPCLGTRACIQLGGVCQGTEQNQTRNSVL
jgi:hypothetical protein